MNKQNVFGVKFPELSREWHLTKNGLLTPMDVTYGLSKKVWWQCKEGHEWEASLNNRSKGKGCPYCAGVKVSPETSLQNVKPVIAEEWHPTKNTNVTPLQVMPYSDKKVWWLCKKGHEWKTQVKTRSRGSSCPYCTNRMVNEENRLSATHPALAEEWHPSKNNNLSPNEVVSGSNKKVWWMCPKGHEYEAKVEVRVHKDSGCPFCANVRVCNDNCLATVNPDLAKEWHLIKNGELTPNDVVPGSNKKVWWICSDGHEWRAVINSRNGGNHSCPYCTNQKVYEGNCLENMNPALAREWHPTKNGELTPRDVTAGSIKEVWWQCKKNRNHVWKSSVGARHYAGYGCRKCTNQTSFPEQALFYYVKKIYGKTASRKKFGKHELDLYVPELNIGIEYDGYHHSLKGGLERDLRKDSFFKEMNIPLIRIRSYECPTYDSGENIVVLKEDQPNGKGLKRVIDLLFAVLSNKTEDKELKEKIDTLCIDIDADRGEIYTEMRKSRLKRSFGTVFPGLINEWHKVKNGELTPFEIAPYSNRKYWWQCNKGHEFEQRANDRGKGQKCPYCMGQKATKETKLSTVHPDIASEWHWTKNKDLTPETVTFGSNRKVWWKCRKGHEYEAVIANRTSKKTGCPHCRRFLGVLKDGV